MRSLAASQAALMARRTLAAVRLVVLTTYTDRGELTVDTVYRFSDRPVLYPYGGGAAVQFESYITAIGDQERVMNHLPSPSGDDAAAAAGNALLINFSNRLYSTGISLLEEFRSGNIEFARIEVSTVLADPALLRNGLPYVDLRALAGTEHIVTFRGEVRQIANITETEFQLRCAMEDVQLPWIYASDPSINDPMDSGVRLPVVYGAAKRVPCIGWQVGWITTLAEPITTPTETGVKKVTDVTGLPASGSVRIGSEEVAYSSKSDANSTITISARGQNGTAKQLHPAGDLVVELITTAIFAVAGHAVKAINDVYAISPYTRKLTKITTAFTKTASDGSTISGKTIASVSFTTAQLRSALVALAAEAKVTVQPTGSVATQRDAPISTTVGGTDDPRLRDGVSVGQTGPGAIGAGGVTITFRAPPATPTSQVLRAYLLATSGEIEFRVGSSSGTLLGSTNPGADGWYGFATTNTGNVFWIGPSSGSLYVRDIDRLVDSSCNNIQQYGIDAGDDGLRDINEDVGIELNNTGKTVTFPSYAGAFQAQTIRLVRTTTAGDGEVLMGGVLIGVLGAGDPVGVYEFKTTESGDSVLVRHDSGGLGTVITVSEVTRIVHVVGGGSDAEITAAQIGFGLRLFADLDGVAAPNGTDYSVGNGVLLEKPADVIKHFIAVYAGRTMAAIDDASFDAAITNLGSDKFAVWVNPLGSSFWSVLSGLAYSARANIVSEEGDSETVYRLLTASSSYAFDTAIRAMVEWGGAGEEGRDGSTLVDRFRFAYGFDPSVAGGSDEAAWNVLTANKDQNDISAKLATSFFTAAEERYGPRLDVLRALQAVSDQATAIEVSAYYAKELMRQSAVFTLTGVPWWLAYDLERGDIVSFQPPWRSAAVAKGRIIRVSRTYMSELLNLKIVEVL